jgi:hypothetical protein
MCDRSRRHHLFKLRKRPGYGHPGKVTFAAADTPSRDGIGPRTIFTNSGVPFPCSADLFP